MAHEENGRTVFDRPLDPGEPLFCLRGNDALAQIAVRTWINEAKERGVRPAVIDHATRILAAMEAWTPTKLPD